MQKSIFLCLLFFLINSNICSAAETKRVIAFDLHGVVLHYNWRSLAPRLWQYPHKWQLLKNLPSLPVFALIKTLWNKPSFEQVLQLCGQHNPFLKELLIDLSSQQNLAEDVAAIIDALAKQGHTLHVISNIGSACYQRISHRYPDTFKNFSSVTTSNTRDQEGNLIKKPDTRFFENYLRKHKLKPEQITFIDDRVRNVAAATNLGMHAILFKNAEQLQKELKSHNLLVD